MPRRQKAAGSGFGAASPDRARQPIRGVLFDLDGTLYWQPPLRVCMAVELGAWSLLSGRGFSDNAPAGIIATFRKAREELRALGPGDGVLDEMQFEEPAKRLGCPGSDVRPVVVEWMFRRPLKYLKVFRRRGLIGLLAFLDSKGVKAGVLSDYPPGDKLRALGLQDRFSLALCTTDGSINRLKPHPIGFERACERWGLPPRRVLYVGDRPEVDAVGARAAGMPCAILTSGWPRRRKDGAEPLYWSIQGFAELQRALSRLI